MTRVTRDETMMHAFVLLNELGEGEGGLGKIDWIDYK